MSPAIANKPLLFIWCIICSLPLEGGADAISVEVRRILFAAYATWLRMFEI